MIPKSGGGFTTIGGINMGENDWLKLYFKIQNDPSKSKGLHCPICKNQSIRFQYVGDERNMTGILSIWCDSCLKGIRVGKVNIPKNIAFLSNNLPEEEIRKRIPNFQLIAHFN